jgi:uncharacterized protein
MKNTKITYFETYPFVHWKLPQYSTWYSNRRVCVSESDLSGAFDCNRTNAEGTKRICQFSRQHQMHTPTRVLTGFHHSKGHSLWQYSTWYSKRRVCASESDILERLIVIEPKQKVQNEYVSSQDNIKFARQHEYSPDSTTPTAKIY